MLSLEASVQNCYLIPNVDIIPHPKPLVTLLKVNVTYKRAHPTAQVIYPAVRCSSRVVRDRIPDSVICWSANNKLTGPPPVQHLATT